MYTKGELCSCGFPQSHPLPHEHDRTDRENQIIAHFESTQRDMYEALKQYERVGFFNEFPTYLEGLRNIIAKAEGK